MADEQEAPQAVEVEVEEVQMSVLDALKEVGTKNTVQLCVHDLICIDLFSD